ncbi:porin, partial [Phaeospirillum tilakii]
NDTAKSLICGVGGVGGTFRAAFAGGAGVTSCNPDYNIGQLGLITRWTPVKNLTFSADVTYVHLDQKYAGTITTSAGAIGKPVATYELKKFALKGFEERSERNHTFFYQRRMSERRGLARRDHDEEEKPVEFNLRAVGRWLVERYAGDAGVRLELCQVAKKLVQELRLE